MNLNQITVPTIDLERSIEFYQKLGLKLIVKSTEKYARFVCPDGSSTFSLHIVDALPSGSGIVVYFECDNLDEHVNQLIAKGIKFDEMPDDKSWLWREAKLKDPDGNQLKLFFAGENRKNPPWRLKSS